MLNQPIDLAAYRSSRTPTKAKPTRAQTRVFSRQLLAEAIHMEIPLPDPETSEPILFVFVPDPRTFAVSPDASDFELKVAAWGCALRLARLDNPSWVCTRSQLNEIVDLMGPTPEATLDAAMTGTD